MIKEAYVYSYVNKITKKIYIGSRSGYNTTAEEDFNIKYKSSSKNEEFLNDMNNNLLDGYIILKINCENSNKKIVQIEHKLIQAYWDKFGKENSYNRYCNGNFSMAGHKHSEKTKAKLSLQHKGKKSPIAGKHLTDEQKAHLRTFCGEKSSMYGKKRSKETCEKLSKALKGRTFSEETRQKLSIAGKGRHVSEETKQRISKTLKGRTFSEETKLKMKLAAQGKNKGRLLSKEQRDAISNRLKGHKCSEETKMQISSKLKGLTRKLYLYYDENNDQHIMDRANKNKWHPNWIEIKEIENE